MEAKVVLDEKACSKRFGFVTYSTKEEADEVLKQKTLYLFGKKVNVGPAVKKEVLNFVPVFRYFERICLQITVLVSEFKRSNYLLLSLNLQLSDNLRGNRS